MKVKRNSKTVLRPVLARLAGLLAGLVAFHAPAVLEARELTVRAHLAAHVEADHASESELGHAHDELVGEQDSSGHTHSHRHQHSPGEPEHEHHESDAALLMTVSAGAVADADAVSWYDPTFSLKISLPLDECFLPGGAIASLFRPPIA
jgi:hypothetical protein